MRQLNVSLLKGGLGPLFVLLLSSSCQKTPITFEDSVKTLEVSYRQDLLELSQEVGEISESEDQQSRSEAYIEARSNYKKLEPILQYLSDSNYKFLNGPNISRVEEEDATNIKELEVTGFQVIEEIVFDSAQSDALNYHVKLTADRLQLLSENVDFTYIKAHHILWMIRDALLRVGITGITPFDSPVLDAQLEESALFLEGLEEVIQHFEGQFESEELFNLWITRLDSARQHLKADSFNAYRFVKDDQQALLDLYRKTVADWSIRFPLELAIRNEAETLFSKSTFNLAYFAKRKAPNQLDEIVQLGKRLFNESRLSAEGTMSCATCHQNDRYLTDGLILGADQSRNTPSLYYTGLQQAYFYDNRSGSLEGQIISVINNESEFHSSVQAYSANISEDIDYQKAFVRLFQREVNDADLRDAIGAYIRQLNPFNSKFDRNMRGEEQTLTESEINGFNLFMGKAQCATCHFMPIFNGTVPTKFAESEMELIGVPSTNDTLNVAIDEDLGRYYVFGTEKKKYFFKTPTVRNVAMTAPYMHNGVYQTLEEVVDFYNRGGGAGMGLDLPYQTLPAEPLGLTGKEQADLVAFMQTLTDKLD